MEGLANLGIDFYSILIYVVNFGLLLGVLTYLLYKPVQKLIDERQTAIAGKIEEADRIKTEFENRLNEMRAEKERAQAELKEELSKMETFVSQKKAELLAEMDEERTKMLAKTNAEIDKRKKELLSEAEQQILKLIQRIVLEIVQHKVPKNVVEESVNEAWSNYKS